MKLPANVKPKTLIWNIFPFSKRTAQAIYPNIYFPKEIYQDLISDNPDPYHVAALKHEQTHILRQKKKGWTRWGLSYLLFPKFRFEEELIAIKSTMKHLNSTGYIYDTDRGARFLSSWVYLWCVSYKKAKYELDKAKKNIYER